MATELKFYGISETLFYLKNYEKDLYDSLRKDLVTASQPLAKLVGAEFPDEALSQWHTSGGRLTTKSRLPPYNGSIAQKSVKPKAGTGSARGGTRGSVILRIQQMDGGGQVYDSAGSKGGRGMLGERFIHNLDTKFGGKSRVGKYRSRVLYGAVKSNEGLIEQEVLTVVNKINAYTTKAINAGTGK